MINIRAAGLDDCDDLLNWRNDESTRMVSFDQHEISGKEHRVWFERAIRDPKIRIFIGVDENGIKLGMVRFNVVGKGISEISINIAPEERGKGLGKLILQQACERYSAENDGLKMIAKVKISNPASLKVFKSAGFILEPQDKVDPGSDMAVLIRVNK